MRVLLLLCVIVSLAATVPYKAVHSAAGTHPVDSVIMRRYMLQVLSEFEDINGYSEESIDSLIDTQLNDVQLMYAPDSSFKIFTIQAESCGAYCNATWYSWIHYDLKGFEKYSTANFNTVKSIDRLPDGKYLVLESSWARPAGFYTIGCEDAKLLAFGGDSAEITEPFSYCQENGVEAESFLKYNSRTQTLSYLYGNNDPYDENDVDTIRAGRIKYFEGNFLRREESVTASDRH